MTDGPPFDEERRGGDGAAALAAFFAFFNEVGIIQQLSRAAFEARLPKGVTVAHFSVLNHLIRVRDGQTPLRIAGAFQVPKTTMTHTLAGLESRGFVELRPNPKDGRSKQVWLTDAGRAFREEAIGRLAPDVAALARTIDPAEIAAALPLLEKVRKTLDEARDLPDG
ncbi:MAG: MarR family transcriptional regulator [Pseudomonadota bacterium]